MDTEKFITLTAVGDVCFSGSVEHEFFNKGIDPFESVKCILKESDLAFCNLESPLTESNNKQNRHYSKILNSDSSVYLKSDPIFGKVLKNSNFNIVSIANNHILDYNEKGLHDTIKVLKNEDIPFIGAGCNLNEARKAYLFEKNDIKIGFLAYSYTYEATSKSAGATPLWKNIILKDLKEIKSKVDHVVISLHFGTEFSNTTSLSERKLAYLLIDNGADLILGHHPHVLREVEHYKNGLIAYSLGNFVFDIFISKINSGFIENIRKSIILKFKITKNEILVDKVYPVYLSENGVPYISTKEKQFTILYKLNFNSTSNPNKINISGRYQIKNYFEKFLISIKLIYASVKICELNNIYLIFKRYFNFI